MKRVMRFRWGNNARRAELQHRSCVILAHGAMGSVLVEFIDTAERVVCSRRALIWTGDTTQ